MELKRFSYMTGRGVNMLFIGRPGRSRVKQQSGATLVEYALLLSILMILIMAGITGLGFASEYQILYVAQALDINGGYVQSSQLSSDLNSNGNGGYGLSLGNGGLGGGSESTITPGTIFALPEPGASGPANLRRPTF